MQIYLLIVLMLVILCWAYRSMNNDLASPAVMFAGPFCVALIFAAAYQDKWELNMHIETFLVLLCGCFEFVLICTIIHKTVGVRWHKRWRKRRRRIVRDTKKSTRPIRVERWKVVGIILIQLVSICVIYSSVRSSLGKYGISGDFTTLVYYFREYKMFSDYEVGISSLASNFQTFSIGVTYIWIYIICDDFVRKAKIKNLLLMLTSIALGVINSVMLGSRGGALQIIVAIIVCYLFLQKKYNCWKPKLKMQQIFLIAAIMLLLMFTFNGVGNLLGRNSVINYSTTAVGELAKYMGAEIKNLDIYLENPFEGNQMAGSQTFGVILSWISKRLHLGWNVETVLPFQKVGGISLGNVYTVFYAYIYDFGYVGAAILTMVFAVLVQLIYEYATLERKRKINFRIILNSYVLSLVVFSFFGERFFAAVLNTSFIKYILLWKFMIWFVTRLRVKRLWQGAVAHQRKFFIQEKSQHECMCEAPGGVYERRSYFCRRNRQ